MSLKN